VRISCSFEASVVEFKVDPDWVQLDCESVKFQEVEWNVGNYLFLKGWAIGTPIDAILESKRFELFVPSQTIFNRLRNLIPKSFDVVDYLHEISEWTLGRLEQDFACEDHNFPSSFIIDTRNYSCGVGQKIFLESAVEGELDYFLIGDSVSNC